MVCAALREFEGWAHTEYLWGTYPVVVCERKKLGHVYSTVGTVGAVGQW